MPRIKDETTADIKIAQYFGTTLMIETMASIKELGASATPSLFNSKLIRVSDPLVLTKGHKEKE